MYAYSQPPRLAPGADLHVDVRGEGPALLLIPGGNGDRGPYDRLAELMSDRYTVVSYDRRGYARSRGAAAPRDELRLATDVADALSLLDEVTGEPANVFGSSSGAIVALALLTRHPDRVATLVAHEPPLVRLLPDAQWYQAFFERIHHAYLTEGVTAAMNLFSPRIGLRPPPLPPATSPLPPRIVEMIDKLHADQAFFFEHELRRYSMANLDLAALAALRSKLVLARGRASSQFFPAEATLAFARLLDTEIVDFPGDHIGYLTQAGPFAVRLAEVAPPA